MYIRSVIKKVLGYLVTQRGIEANPDQIQALIDMPYPRCEKYIQRLNGRIAALNRFISRSLDSCLNFFKMLKWAVNCEWIDKYEATF